MRGSAAEAVTMATSQVKVTPNQIIPFHLSGNTTEEQNRMLQEFLGDAIRQAYQKALVQLDRQSAQAVLDMNKTITCEVAERVTEIFQRHSVSDKYKDEEVRSDRVYPTTY